MPYIRKFDDCSVTIAKASDALPQDKAQSRFITTLFKTAPPSQTEIILPLADASIEEMRMAEKALEEKNPLQPFDYPVAEAAFEKKLGVAAMGLVTTVAAGTAIDAVKSFEKPAGQLSTGSEMVLTSLALGAAVAYGYGMKLAYEFFKTGQEMLAKSKPIADQQRTELLQAVKFDILARENQQKVEELMSRNEPSFEGF